MKSLYIVCLLVTLSSCAVTGNNYKNSIFSTKNQAPESVFSAREVSGKLIDDVHLKTKGDYHYALGESLSLDGDSKRAIEEFKMTLVYDPKSPVVLTRLAAEYLRSGLVNEALEEVQAATKADPTYKEARVLLGGIYSSLKMYDESEEQYVEMLKQDPKSYEAYIYLGALLAEQGKFNESKIVFKKLVKVADNDNSHVAHYYLARVYHEQGGLKNENKAIKELEKALTIKPDHKESVTHLARIYQEQDRIDKSIEIFLSYQDRYGPLEQGAAFLSQYYLEGNQLDKALEQLQFLEGFHPGDLSTKTKMALILVERKKYEKAIDKLLAILKVDPTLDKIRFYLGAVYEEVNLSENALVQYNEVNLGSDYFPDAILHSALILQKLEREQEALDKVSEGLQKRKDIPELYSLKASLLSEARAYKEASIVMTEAVKVFPANTDIRYMHATMLDKVGSKGETIAELEKLIAQDPEHVQALNYLAYTYADSGKDLNKAMKLAKIANKLKPNDAYILDTIGWIYFKKGNMRMAIQNLEKAHRFKPDESIVAEHLGDAYYKYQLTAKARIMYEKALELENEGFKVDRIKTKLTSIKEQILKPINSRMPASN